MTQTPPSNNDRAQPSIQQQALDSTLGSGQQAAIGNNNIQVQENNNWIINLFSHSDCRRLRLLVHRAVFCHTGQECYFLNLTNLSRNREIEITHIWLESEPKIHIFNSYRPLPKRLKPDEVWETWISIEKVPASVRHNPYNLVRARLSSGDVVASIENKNVPEMGTVPGGSISY